MSNLSMAFRFRAVRERRNLSIVELAAKSNTSRNTISLLERGRDVKVSTLLALSAALNTPANSWFLSDQEWFEWFCTGFRAPQPVAVEVQPPQHVREYTVLEMEGDFSMDDLRFVVYNDTAKDEWLTVTTGAIERVASDYAAQLRVGDFSGREG
jgi:transcriptional regulator with XRE-family HTH domain